MNTRLGVTYVPSDIHRDSQAGNGNLAVQFTVSHCSDWDSPTALHVLREIVQKKKIKHQYFVPENHDMRSEVPMAVNNNTDFM
jgi:hypothetical protein